jgi:ABC-2 type transport system permease protein
MSKLWLIAKDEFRRNVYKKSFILALLSVPLMLAFNVGIGLIVENLEKNPSPIGYVDHSGLLDHPIQAYDDNSSDAVPIIAFDSEDAAREALLAKEIQAFYVLSADYRTTSNVELYYVEEPAGNATSQWYDFLQANLLANYPPEIAKRLIEGTRMTIRSPGGIIEMPAGGPTLSSMLPLITSVAFVFLLLFSSGYLMSGVITEKENRTIEVIVTSVSTNDLVVGKVMGIVAISLTQLTTWILIAVLTIAVGGNVFGLTWFQDLSINWIAIAKVIVIALPSYIFAAGLMFTVGSTLTEAQEGQSVGSLFFLLHILPIYMIVTLVENPLGIQTTLLGILPFTALLTTGLRSIFTDIPLWQITLSAAVQTLCAVGALLLASRAFRLGMLRYGQRLRIRELFRRRLSLEERKTS